MENESLQRPGNKSLEGLNSPIYLGEGCLVMGMSVTEGGRAGREFLGRQLQAPWYHRDLPPGSWFIIQSSSILTPLKMLLQVVPRLLRTHDQEAASDFQSKFSYVQFIPIQHFPLTSVGLLLPQCFPPKALGRTGCAPAQTNPFPP